MKYTIMGFSQAKAVELGLDVQDLTILRWFIDYKETSKMVQMIIEGKPYYWINYKGIIEDLPIINIKKDTLYRRLKKLVEKEVLIHISITKGGTFSYYNIGKNYLSLINFNSIEKPDEKKSEGTEKNPGGYGFKSVGGTEKNPDQIINLLNNTNLLNNNKKKKKKENEFDLIINNYTDNEDLKNTIYEFIKMRKTIKSPMTSNALKLMLNKLERLEPDDINRKILVLEQSIMNSWKGIFELKENGGNKVNGYRDREPKQDTTKNKWNIKKPEYTGPTYTEEDYQEMYRKGELF